MARKLPAEIPRQDPRIEILSDLGTSVRNARAMAKLHIDDAAAFAGVSADTLSRLENGKPVTTDRLMKILGALGLVPWLVPREPATKVTEMVREPLAKF